MSLLALLIGKCLYFSLKSFIGIGLGAGAYILSRCAVSISSFPCDFYELWSSSAQTDHLWGRGKVAGSNYSRPAGSHVRAALHPDG